MAARIVNTHEAKSRLSELIREVEAGGDVIVARNGQPVAKIIPWPPSKTSLVPGKWAGKIEYLAPLVGLDDDIAALFDESIESP
jgi:prevent-host-death family protein